MRFPFRLRDRRPHAPWSAAASTEPTRSAIEDALKQELGRTRVLHHQPERIEGETACVEAVGDVDDGSIVRRVLAAYSAAITTRVGRTDSIWLDFFANANKETHEVLRSGDIAHITAMLRDPASSMLFYGFDNLCAAEAARIPDPGWQYWLHLITYSSLLKFAEATGVVRVDNPEAPFEARRWPSPDTLLAGLDEVLGFRIDFPNLFSGEIGARTKRGVASYRAIQAIYQVFRIKELLGRNSDAHVLEIGGGLGRTAYYARRAGIARYTIVDLPLTNVAQGYFLGRSLGVDSVSLYGESGQGPIRIQPPSAFLEADERYDLIVNIDSLTEMSRSTAVEYLDAMATRTPAFLSINHEHNAFTVRELYRERGLAADFRIPCWVRRGYVEELIRFRSPSAG